MHLALYERAQILPPDRDPLALAEEFSAFFTEKVEAIRARITNGEHTEQNQPAAAVAAVVAPTCTLANWRPVSQDEVRKIIMNSPTKHCGQDPLPTWLLKKCLGPLLPSITAVLNHSLATGCVPDAFKIAHVTPLIKKPSLDPSVLANYRPVSNLTFLSKVLERAVNTQLNDYIKHNGLHEKYQSAYRKYHSTETALIRVQNDILLALGDRKVCLLLLLDLSSAFDTVDHAGLLNTLSEIGLKDIALAWFSSYLRDRYQCVRIGDDSSSHKPLLSGVPQGSVLGPVLFTLYTASLGRVIETYSLNYHFYADDTSLYLTFEVTDLPDAVDRMQQCAEAVRQWMIQNMLKMNADKTELLMIATKNVSAQIPSGIPVLTVGGAQISPSEVVKYIGVLMDRHLLLDSYVDDICKTARMHLYRIGRVRHLLTKNACAKLIHAFVSSRLDSCNALLVGLPKRQLQKIQLVQNSAARLLTLTGRREHITPILRELHWLPVAQRVQFRVAMHVYKCLHHMAPLYLEDLLHCYIPGRPLRSAETNLLQTPRSANSICDRAFSVIAPKIWNSLENEIRAEQSIDVFKKKLKTFLFRRAFY